MSWWEERTKKEEDRVYQKMEKEREKERKDNALPHLKSSLRCKEDTWDTMRKAKRQLKFVVSLKFLSAQERAHETLFEREHHECCLLDSVLRRRRYAFKLLIVA